MFVLQYHFPLDSIMIPFFHSVSQFHEGGQDAAATLSVAKGNEEEQVRVVCIYNTMVFVLHFVRACPYPQTTSPLASVYQTMSPNEWVKSPKKWVNENGEVVESNDRPNQVSMCLCYNIIFHLIVS